MQLILPQFPAIQSSHPIILPLTIYRRHEKELLAQPLGHVHDFSSRFAFKILRDDPIARLVIYICGTAGCMAPGYRPDAYRALFSAAPDRIHVVTVGYRGYGLSSGTPSEEGLLLDAIALTKWAMDIAKIPASRIVIFAQSLGTAVAISLLDNLAAQEPPVSFAGTVLLAPFSDVSTVTATYCIGGIIPVMSSLSLFPPILALFNGFIKSSGLSKDRIARFVKRCESEKIVHKYQLTFIHAQDDTTIPCSHSEVLYWYAVNATTPIGVRYEDLEQEKVIKKNDLSQGGWNVEWRTKKCVIGQEMLKYGSHDKIGTYPGVVMAVYRIFQNADQAFRR